MRVRTPLSAEPPLRCRQILQVHVQNATQISLQARKFWLSVGAAANVEVTVDGTPTELSPGTVSVVLPEDATSPANEAR